MEFLPSGLLRGATALTEKPNRWTPPQGYFQGQVRDNLLTRIFTVLIQEINRETYFLRSIVAPLTSLAYGGAKLDNDIILDV